MKSAHLFEYGYSCHWMHCCCDSLYRKYGMVWNVLYREFKLSMKLTINRCIARVRVCVDYVWLSNPPWMRCKNAFSINSCLKTAIMKKQQPNVTRTRYIFLHFFCSFLQSLETSIYLVYIHSSVHGVWISSSVYCLFCLEKCVSFYCFFIIKQRAWSVFFLFF